MILKKIKKLILGSVFFVLVYGFIISPFSYTAVAAGASLTFSPNRGDLFVDNTFEVSLIVNTGGQPVNAIEAFVNFPPDKLQVVSLSKSLIELWVAQPSFSNTKGTVSLQGGIPNPGINTSAGSIITITFRAKSAGAVTLTYGDSSKVLANDGSGTNLLNSKGQASYNINLAPPAGPIVTSHTHEDQNRWYKNTEIALSWAPPGGVTEYSYLLDVSPNTTPDETAESSETSVTLVAENSGLWYFHIRGKSTSWGGTTHFLVKIDNKNPAGFNPTVEPSVFANNSRGIVKFGTTDSASGIDHYEIKIINLSEDNGESTIFTEESSPYLIPELQPGKYKFVVRAFDRAGNFIEESIEFRVSSPFIALLLGRPFLTGATLLTTLLLLFMLLILWRRHKHQHNRVRELQGHISNIQEQITSRQAEIASLATTQDYLQQQIDPNQGDSPGPKKSQPPSTQAPQ